MSVWRAGVLAFLQLEAHLYQRHVGDLVAHRLVAGDMGRRPGTFRLWPLQALLTATIAFLAWLARAGSIVNFVSNIFLIGFKAGVALQLASTQLPKLFGVKGGHGNFWERMDVFFRHVGETNASSLMLGCAGLGLLILGKKLLPNKPVALFVVIGGIAAASFVDFGAHGVKLLGEVPRGLPMPSLPAVHWDDLGDLLPLALACFLLGAVETAAIGQMFAEKHGYRLDSNQEFLALAGANFASGLGHGFPVSGGMSQSLVNESSGARTPLSGLLCAILIGLVAVFFSELLRNLPQPVLAAIVLMAVAGLVKVRELRHLWQVHRNEFLVATVALLGVLWAGLLKGVLIGAIISLVLLIRRVSSPHVAFLGRIPGARRYSDLKRHADNEPIPGVLAFRVESSIVYFNSAHVFDTVLAHLDAAREPISLVICDLSTSPNIDMAGSRMFLRLHAELAKREIAFGLVEARSTVRDMLRVEGIEERRPHRPLHDARGGDRGFSKRSRSKIMTPIAARARISIRLNRRAGDLLEGLTGILLCGLSTAFLFAT